MHRHPIRDQSLKVVALLCVVALSACGGPEPGPVVTLENGIMYRVLREGTGDTIRVGDSITAHYALWLPDSMLVDTTMRKYGGDGEPFPTEVGVGRLIQGWDMTLPGMRVGEVRWLFVPSEYGYGERGTRGIPPNADLTFEFQIVSKQ